VISISASCTQRVLFFALNISGKLLEDSSISK
jgi:hypothetical protein